MEGLYFADRLEFRRDLPFPEPPAGWSRVRVTMAGICNTDLEIVRGYMDYRGILGHEFVGVVESTGTPALRGKRVVGEINAACGVCEACRMGNPRHCPNRTVLGIQELAGAFAEYLVLPDRNLHVVPDSLPDEQAVFVEPVAAACEILDQVRVKPTDRALVIGAGKLGLLVAQVLRTAGCAADVLVRRRNRERLVEGLGLAPVREAALAERRYDLVVEASGNPDGFRLATRCVRPRGTIVLKSTYAGELSLWAAGLVLDEVTVVGSRCGPFPPALAMLSSGEVKTADLVSGRFPLRRGLTAFRRASAPGTLKVLLEIGASAS